MFACLIRVKIISLLGYADLAGGVRCSPKDDLLNTNIKHT